MANNVLQNCVCGNKQYGLMGRPACVTTMEDLYTFIIRPRFKTDGTRNTTDIASATLGNDIKALIQQSTAAESRVYPYPRVFDFTAPSTEAKYETMTDDTKFKLNKVGEVYTWTGKLKDKDAAFRAFNEIDKTGCGDVDIWYVDKAFTIWMVLEDFTSTITRGIGITSASFTSAYEFATAANTNGINLSFDLVSKDEIKMFVGITQEEHGLVEADFKPLIPIDTLLTAVSSTVLTMNVHNPYLDQPLTGFLGLVDAETVMTDDTAAAVVAGATAEVGLGVYTFTAGSAMTAGNVITNAITPASLTGYFFNPSSVTAIA